MPENIFPTSKYWEHFDVTYSPYWEDVKEAIIKHAGSTYANRIDKLLDERSEGNMKNDSFYSYKNSDYAGSIAFGIAYDGSLLDNTSKWIMDNKAVFTGEILDVGCENGLLTCFIAWAFPGVSVTGIDTCNAAIINAKRLAEELELSNISFQSKSLRELQSQYDTVFSLRVLHENIKDCNVDFSLSPAEIAKIYAPTMIEFSSQVSRVVKDEGRYISIERIPYEQMELGWMLSLAENCLWPTEIDKVRFNEQGLYSSFWATIAEKHNEKLRQGKVFGLYKRFVGDPWATE